MDKTLLGLLSGLGAAAIWGGMYVVSKVVLEVIPPFALITLRLILGALVLFGAMFFQHTKKTKCSGHKNRAESNQSKSEVSSFFLRVPRVKNSSLFWQIFGVGIIGYGISLGFQFVGTKLSTAANGSLVTSATPAFVLLFAGMLLHERITARRLIALLVSTLGVLAVIDPRTASLNPDLYWGNLSLLAAALTWALYSVLVRKITNSLDVLPFSAIAFLGGLPVSIPLGAWEVAAQGVGVITWGIIGGVLFLGIISTALAMLLWNTAFAQLDASLASLTFFAQPVVGTALGSMFLGEIVTPLFVLGGLLIGLGLIIASRAS